MNCLFKTIDMEMNYKKERLRTITNDYEPIKPFIKRELKKYGKKLTVLAS